MFNEYGDYHRELQVAGGFPVQIDYFSGDLTLSIHSLTDYVSGGDWGAGYRYSYNWELKIPVYDGDWQTAESKAIRRYEQHIARQKRQAEVAKELSEHEKKDSFYKLVVHSACKYETDERFARLQVAGFKHQAQLEAEQQFLDLLHCQQWQEAQKLAERYAFEMPEDWQSDWFDDLVVVFTERGCYPKSEELVCQLLELDEAKARQVLPSIAIAKSEGRLESERFIDFLIERGIFDSNHRLGWAKKVLLNLIEKWLSETIEGAVPDGKRDQWKEQHQKEALTLWRRMAEWCEAEGIGREEVQAAAVEYVETHRPSPVALELLESNFDLYSPLIDRKVVEYLAEHIKQDIYETYGEFVPRALELAKSQPTAELLEGWVPLSFEEKQGIARALIQKILASEELWSHEVEQALKWNEDFKLHISELDALARVIERAATPETEEPKRELARRGILLNFGASDKFVRLLRILADKGPSAEIRLRAEELQRWLEYEVEKSFPNRPITVDFWAILALSHLRGDVPVGPGLIDAIDSWLQAEPRAAESQDVLELATGLERAVENVLSGPSRRVARKMLNLGGGEQNGSLRDH